MADATDTPPPDSDDRFGRPSDDEIAALAESANADGMAALNSMLERLPLALDTRAVYAGDPVALSALRLIHAVVTAAAKRDLSALQSWENDTLRYMQKHALDEYVKMPLPPRATKGRTKHDRHLIMSALRDRVAKYLKSQKGRPEKVALLPVMTQLQAMVSLTFLDHPHVDDEIKRGLLFDRVFAHLQVGRPLAELDPEEVILDALEAIGVPRPTGHGWLKGAKE